MLGGLIIRRFPGTKLTDRARHAVENNVRNTLSPFVGGKDKRFIPRRRDGKLLEEIRSVHVPKPNGRHVPFPCIRPCRSLARSGSLEHSWGPGQESLRCCYLLARWLCPGERVSIHGLARRPVLVIAAYSVLGEAVTEQFCRRVEFVNGDDVRRRQHAFGVV